MRKAIKLYVLLGVLALVCAAAFLVSRHEEKKEQIKNSGEVILAIPAEDVTALSWEGENGAFAFTWSDGWTYDGDAGFPVDDEAIGELLAQFETFSAAFVIEDVEDYAQYGLDDPVCTIRLTVGEDSYTVELGGFSKMDEQRYVSIGDGKAYLVTHDPLEEFDAVLKDLIEHDTIPDFQTVERITFSGAENYTIVRDEEGVSLCPDDVYFADGQPLDTDRVDSYLDLVRALSLTAYASYNVTQEELSAFGFDEPALTVTVEYTGADDEEDAGTLTLYLARNAQEQAAYEEAVERGEEELPTVTCYARVGQSQIVYQITQTKFDSLTAVSYNELRHQNLFTADFDAVTALEIVLDGETYSFARDDSGTEGVWLYREEAVDTDTISAALEALTATDFTGETPSGQEELRLTLTFGDETAGTQTISLFRYDGDSCLAKVDGESVALTARSQVVTLIEAVNKVILNF